MEQQEQQVTNESNTEGWLAPSEVQVDRKRPFVGVFPTQRIAYAVLVLVLAARRRNTWASIDYEDGVDAILGNVGDLPDEDPDFEGAIAEGYMERLGDRRRLTWKTLDLIARPTKEAQHAPKPLTSDDFKIGERVEFYWKGHNDVRRWVPATVLGISVVQGRSFIEVATQWGTSDAEPKAFDPLADEPFVRKLTTPARSLREVYETEIAPLVDRIHAICDEHGMPFAASFQVSRGGRELGDLVSSGIMARAVTDPRLWAAAELIRR